VGLFYVRQKNYAVALEHLGLATEQVDAAPYYAYIYGVALENQGRISDAIKSLTAADQRWPNQYEILLTLILYLEKSGDVDAVLPFLSKLSAIAPAAPEVKQLINKYQSR
jgi:tetratricopeptide (TPR) repeat protein